MVLGAHVGHIDPGDRVADVRLAARRFGLLESSIICMGHVCNLLRLLGVAVRTGDQGGEVLSRDNLRFITWRLSSNRGWSLARR